MSKKRKPDVYADPAALRKPEAEEAPPSAIACINCRFRHVHDSEGFGRCHYQPPQIQFFILNNGNSLELGNWPRVGDTVHHYCHQFDPGKRFKPLRDEVGY